MTKYNIAIIGAGSAGYVGAIRAAQLGAEVCLIESGELGGVCLNWGCIPTKTIMTTVKALRRWRTTIELGIEVHGRPSFDLNKIGERRDRVVRTQRIGVENLLRSYGVKLLRGRAELTGRQTLNVFDDDSEKVVRAEKILLATGSRPKSLPKIPFDGRVVLSSDHAVQLSDIPERILVVGAGSVGAEFAFIYAGLGSKVTVIEMLERVLPLEDRDVSEIVEREMRKWGIGLITRTRVETLLQTRNGATVMLDDGNELQVNKVLLSVGRAFNTEALGLSEVGVGLDEQGAVKVDRELQTTCPGIYAAGDCIGGKLFAHVASKEAIVAVENCLRSPRSIDYRTVPSCTFTVPEVASVGMTEEEARKAGKVPRVGRFDYRSLGKAHADNEIVGMVKIVADGGTDAILGAQIVGHEASSLIHELVIAMEGCISASKLASAVHAHPTLSEAVMEAAKDVHGTSIHRPKPRPS